MRISTSFHRVPHVLTSESGRRWPAELGWLAVPVRHADPQGPTRDLVYVRLPATTDRPGPPCVFLAGGPGNSGIQLLTSPYQGRAALIDALRELGDVIAFDQRGTGLSHPVPAALERWDLPLDEPGSANQVIDRAIDRCTHLRDYWLGRGVDLGAFTTEESADDVASMAEALGIERIRLVGHSYGSHLGISVIRRHPDLVERAVLGLVEGPDQTYKLPSKVEASLELIGVMAADAPELEGAVPELAALARELIEWLEASPPVANVEGESVVVGAYDLLSFICDSLGSQRAIADLPARLLDFERGDVGWLGRDAYSRRTDWLGNAMFWHTDAASGASPERRALIAAEARTAILGDVINHPFPEVERAFGSPDLGDAFRSKLYTGVPVQFQSGSLDGRTPPSNVDELIGGFEAAGHIIVDGAAHSEAYESVDVRTALVDFISGGDPTTVRRSVPFRFRSADLKVAR